MTARDFREIALSFPEAIESAHMSHPDFRVGGRIFATLGYPDEEWGMIKLTPEEQRKFVQAKDLKSAEAETRQIEAPAKRTNLSKSGH